MPRRDPPLPAFVSAAEPVASCRIEARVRFSDCDPMGVLWHGRHLVYCEAARHELSRQIGFGLDELLALGIFAPVIRAQVFHRHPVPAEQVLVCTAALYPSAQVRLYHRYHLEVDGRPCALAETEQVLCTRDYEILLAAPPALARILAG